MHRNHLQVVVGAALRGPIPAACPTSSRLAVRTVEGISFRPAVADGGIRDVVELVSFRGTASSAENESGFKSSGGECIRFTGNPLLVPECDGTGRSFVFAVLFKAEDDVGAVRVVDLGALA